MKITPDLSITPFDEYLKQHSKSNLSEDENRERAITMLCREVYHLGRKHEQEQEPEKITFSNLLKIGFDWIKETFGGCEDALKYSVEGEQYYITCYFNMLNPEKVITILYINEHTSIRTNITTMPEMEALIKAFILFKNE